LQGCDSGIGVESLSFGRRAINPDRDIRYAALSSDRTALIYRVKPLLLLSSAVLLTAGAVVR
jgi:hypothetical protein